MSLEHDGITKTIDHETASKTHYDAVIVGSGISGAIVAHELGKKGFKVLIIEAGPGKDITIPEYQNYLNNFYAAVTKDNNAPYLRNPNAPMARSPDVERLRPGVPNTNAYLVQNGPFVTDSSYARVVGGTTMHWEAKTPRMLPEDFKMRSLFGRGLDWPISYAELEPYYRKAEFEIGVSGSVTSQERAHIDPGTGEWSDKSLFAEGYVYPMHAMPPSYLDLTVARDIDGTDIEVAGESKVIHIKSFPQGRNGIPNHGYKLFNGGKDYTPIGAVSTHQSDIGERCQGNTNCTPICPVQAKYDARKTLAKALRTGNVDLLPQTVASKVVVDPDNGRVTGIEYKHYESISCPDHETGTIRGSIFIIAANAIENARLMLASGLPGSSGLMGRHLMDHPYLLTWGLLPENAGTMRGTVCTSGISDLRSGMFRKKHAGFAIDIHNDGWGWATGSPYSDLADLVDNKNKYGTDLRKELIGQLSRQLLLAFMIELLPEPGNRVTVDPSYTDSLGNMRPVISLDIPEYSLDAAVFGRELSKIIFQRTAAEDFSKYDPLDPGFVNYNGQGFALRGGNHIAGTHIMGTSSGNSVVTSKQRSWDHENLYIVGAGSMPSIGTSNTTLTLAAMCFMSTEAIINDLKQLKTVAENNVL